MARWLVMMIIMLALGMAAAPAHAKKTGDMFDDEGIEVQNRPEVPSDQNYGWRTHPDMFRPPQPFMRTDKDMFDFVPVPANPGIEKEFTAHMKDPGPSG